MLCFWSAFLFVSVTHASYLLLSTHDEENIYVFDAESGDLVTDKLLDVDDIDGDISFRGIVASNDRLYVANSQKDSSFVGTWKCSDINLQRSATKGKSWNLTHSKLSFEGYFTQYDKSSNPGLVHPYGIKVFESDSVESGYMYVSNQDTQSVLLYDNVGLADVRAAGENSEYPGAIATYGSYSEDSDGVRGIAINDDLGLIFVALETANEVLVYDLNDDFKNVYNISNGKDSFTPIDIAYNGTYFENIIFVGDNDKDRVYAFKVKSDDYSEYWESEDSDHLDHPAGITVSQDYVYVVSQNENRIVRFDPTTGSYNHTLVKFKDATGDDLTGESLLYLPDGVCIS